MKRIACFILCLVLIVAVASGCALKKMTFKEADEAGIAFIKENGLKYIKIVADGKYGDDNIKVIIDGAYDRETENAVFSVSYENDEKIETYKDMIKISGNKLYVKITEIPSLSSLPGLGASLTVSKSPLYLNAGAPLDDDDPSDENGEENEASIGLDLSSILGLLGGDGTSLSGLEQSGTGLDLSSILGLLSGDGTGAGLEGLDQLLSGLNQLGSGTEQSSLDLSSVLELLSGSGTSLSGLDTGVSGLDLSSILELLGGLESGTGENQPVVGAIRANGNSAGSGLDILSGLDDIVGKYIEIELPENGMKALVDVFDSAYQSSYEKAEELEAEEAYPYVVKFGKEDARDLAVTLLDSLKENKEKVISELKSLITGLLGEKNTEALESYLGKTVDETLNGMFDDFFEKNKAEDIDFGADNDFEFVRKLAYENGSRYESTATFTAKRGEDQKETKLNLTVTVTAAEPDEGFAEKCTVEEDQIFSIKEFIEDLKNSIKSLF